MLSRRFSSVVTGMYDIGAIYLVTIYLVTMTYDALIFSLDTKGKSLPGIKWWWQGSGRAGADTSRRAGVGTDNLIDKTRLISDDYDLVLINSLFSW